ncbi:MAG: hypothetical protein FLDDKLPJ_02713 [Phycisphaerae bacterium]|nr:hypothetical protein [Phycisphaerae bacterium]
MPGAVNVEPTDVELLARIRAGSEDALRTLMRRHDALIRYTVFRFSRDRCRADPAWLDDIAASCWAALVERARTGGTTPDNLPGLLVTLARNRTITAVRAEDRSLARTVRYAQQRSVEDNLSEDASTVIERFEELARLRDILAGLDEPDRRILAELPLILDRRWTEAARRLDMPESTLRSIWAALKDKIRSAWPGGQTTS